MKQSLKIRAAWLRCAVNHEPLTLVEEDGEQRWIPDPYSPHLLQELPLEERWALRLKRARTRTPQ